MRHYVIILLTLFVFAFLSAQEKKNSLGGSFGFVPKHNDEYMVPTINIIYSRTLSLGHKRMSVGWGFETHFTKYPHYTTGLALGYEFPFGLSATVTPGILYTVQYKQTKPMIQFECSWLFPFKWFDFGPTLEYSYAHDDAHNMIGVSISRGF